MHDDILLTKDCAACDRHAAENGVSGERLMRAAGEAVADAGPGPLGAPSDRDPVRSGQ